VDRHSKGHRVRNNKIMLDEAARSVRRTFLGSIAGTLGMLAVVGAAGAYGMPERLNVQSLSVALTTWHTKFTPMVERAAPMVGRAVMIANDMTQRTAAPVIARISDEAIELWVSRSEAASPIATSSTPETAPREMADAAPAPIQPALSAMPTPEPVVTSAAMPAPGGFTLASFDPVQRMAVPADDVARALPDTAVGAVAPESVVVPLQVEQHAPAAPVVNAETKIEPETKSEAKAEAEASIEAKPEDLPKSVELPKMLAYLPHPKPPLSPAQRLGLHGHDYDKAERCLAQAVYFEARNEPQRGQQAVAQVVLNRVFSPYYPKDVCSVVFQNAHRHLSCQFTFACDGKSEAIRERGAWARATRIAKQTLDAKIWLPEVAKATHYHAAYVRPNWIRDMRVMVRYGLHTFYRPRNWGDGSNEPGWGRVAHTNGRSS
jgi:spore germination cell wall hydrolase CwlJ-like protein